MSEEEFARQYFGEYWLVWHAPTKEFVRVPPIRPLPDGCYKVNRVRVEGEYRQWVSVYGAQGRLRREFWDCPVVAVCRYRRLE